VIVVTPAAQRDLIDGRFAAERVRVDVVQLEEPTFVTAMAIRPDVCTVPQVPHLHVTGVQLREVSDDFGRPVSWRIAEGILAGVKYFSAIASM
jgi:hypothetical protein